MDQLWDSQPAGFCGPYRLQTTGLHHKNNIATLLRLEKKKKGQFKQSIMECKYNYNITNWVFTDTALPAPGNTDQLKNLKKLLLELNTFMKFSPQLHDESLDG